MKSLIVGVFALASVSGLASDFAGIMPPKADCSLSYSNATKIYTVTHGDSDAPVTTEHKSLLEASRVLKNLKELDICTNVPSLDTRYSRSAFENACDLYRNGNGDYVVRNGLDYGRVSGVFKDKAEAIEVVNNLSKSGFCLLKKP